MRGGREERQGISSGAFAKKTMQKQTYANKKGEGKKDDPEERVKEAKSTQTTISLLRVAGPFAS